MPLSFDLPAGLTRLLDEIRAAAGRPYVVGGAVRDALFGLEVAEQDYDVEVFGLGAEMLESVLSRAGRVDAVGQSFRVLKVTGLEGVAGAVDVSLPRQPVQRFSYITGGIDVGIVGTLAIVH